MRINPLIIITLIAAIGVAAISGCSSSRNSAATTPQASESAESTQKLQLKLNRNDLNKPIIGHGNISALPKAIVYKTSSDFSNNVPVTVSESGELLSYPAPTDILAEATPVRLSNGWLISRVGINQNSVFTTFTFNEYRQLKQTPSHDELLKAIIPNSRVTATMQIPMTLEDALANPEKAESYLSIKIKE